MDSISVVAAPTAPCLPDNPGSDGLVSRDPLGGAVGASRLPGIHEQKNTKVHNR